MLEIFDYLFKFGALFVGGVWAVLGFIILKKPAKAAADLREVELKIRQLELTSRRMVVVRTEITATTHSTQDGAGYCILADVSLTNIGTTDAHIRWVNKPPAFTIRRTSFDDHRAASPTEPLIELHVMQAVDPKKPSESHVIRSGSTEHLPFAAYVDQPGVYLLSFRAPLAPTDRSVSIEAGMKPYNPISWTAKRYVIVGGQKDASETIGAGT